MSYRIKKLQSDKAKELGLTIKPSSNPNKKVDVFFQDKKLASIGANKSAVKGKPMMDYASYKLDKPKIAELRRENYIKRHSKEPKTDDKGKPTKSFYSDEILWGKRNDNINSIKPLTKLKKKIIADKKKKEKEKKKEEEKKKKKKKETKKK